jgi:hypothetical protein
VIDSDGTIYVGVHNRCVAVSADGKQKWEYQGGDWTQSTPAIGEESIYFVCGDRTLSALRDGTRKWYAWVNASVSSPVIGPGNVIYVQGNDPYLPRHTGVVNPRPAP